MIYLDNGATTFPKPRTVYEAIAKANTTYGANPGRSGHRLSLKASLEIYNCRKEISDLFNLKSIENIIFTLNCTTAINIVLKGLLKKGDHVVISSLEHNAVVRPLEALKSKGIEYSVADVKIGDDEYTINSFRKQIKEKTKLIVCMQVSNVWGIRLPIERLTALAHLYDIPILVDAAQGAGLYDLDLSKNNIDYLCLAGHKSLYGPMGTGILIFSDDKSAEKIQSFIEGGTGSSSAILGQPDNLPDKFESGTQNMPGIVGLKEGIKFVKSKGIKQIEEYELSLTKRLYNNLKNINNIELYTKEPDGYCLSPILSFNIKGMDSEAVASQLNNYDVAVRGGMHCAPFAHNFMGTMDRGAVRIVPSIFTMRSEIEKVSFYINNIVKNNK